MFTKEQKNILSRSNITVKFLTEDRIQKIEKCNTCIQHRISLIQKIYKKNCTNSSFEATDSGIRELVKWGKDFSNPDPTNLKPIELFFPTLGSCK